MDGIVIVAILAVAFLFFAVKGDKKQAVSKPATKSTQEKPTTVADLKKLTKNQLVELADKKNLKVKKSGSKAAVISEIREQLK
jgi:hypothetical protein